MNRRHLDRPVRAPASSATLAALLSDVADQLEITAGTLDVTTRFTEDLHLDSLDAVALLIAVEERFGVVITDDEARQLNTLGEAAALIDTRLQR